MHTIYFVRYPDNSNIKWKKVMKQQFYLLLLLFSSFLHATHVTIVGCGYVGLTMAGVLLKCGHSVVCVDINRKKIAQLKNKTLPIYEPQLKELLFADESKILFVNTLGQAADSEVFFICVATPTEMNGACDYSFLYAAFHEVLDECSKTGESKIVCVKSTVPPGTLRKLHDIIQEKNLPISLVYNPEFMREGSALEDVYNTNPIVLAGEFLDAVQRIEELYRPIMHSSLQIIKTNFETAELIKYGWNAFSALRIAYVNELALLCRAFDADISAVVQGLALSEGLLPTNALKPGPGYGGSCLPKDVLSFSKVVADQGIAHSIIHHIINSNNHHIGTVVQDIYRLLGKSRQKKIITLLGLSYKPCTDDIRNAPAIEIIKALSKRHDIRIHAYDPQAISNTRELFPDITYFDSPYQAMQDADCIVVLTEWDEIKKIDLDKVALLCNKKVIIDTRNIFDTATLKRTGFTYINMGVP